MGTYLLTWNPRLFVWTREEIRAAISAIAAGRTLPSFNWSTGARKQMSEGDRLFLIRLGSGVRPKGIVAAGWAEGGVQQGRHWRGGRGKSNYVTFRPDVLLDGDTDSILEQSALKKLIPEGQWSAQGSGIEIPTVAARKLERLWSQFLATGAPRAYRDEQDELGAVEGELVFAMRRHRTREARLRQAKIREALQGGGVLRCSVPGCAFDFRATYGPLGEGYAHVHHTRPLADAGKRKTRLSDLRIVCANCHAMIHRRGGDMANFGGLIRRRKLRGAT